MRLTYGLENRNTRLEYTHLEWPIEQKHSPRVAYIHLEWPLEQKHSPRIRQILLNDKVDMIRLVHARPNRNVVVCVLCTGHLA